MSKLGLDLKRRYKKNFLDNRAGSINNHIKAFSSDYQRCIDSLNITLKALLDPANSRHAGYNSLAESLQKSDNQFVPITFTLDDWKKISIDVDSIFMSWSDIQNKCIKGYSYVGTKNLLLDPDIKKLPGINRFETIVKEHFNSPLNVSILAIMSNLKNELEIARTRSTIHYLDDVSSWIDEPVKNDQDLPITLSDVGEQVALVFHQNQFTGAAKLLQVGSLFSSMVRAQNEANELSLKPINGLSMGTMNLYNTHDSTIQVLLTELGIIELGQRRLSFEKRFEEGLNRDRIFRFLNGLQLPEYGATLLVELQTVDYTDMKLPNIRMFLYNEPDVKLDGPIEWIQIKIGLLCREKLIKMGVSEETMNTYFGEWLYMNDPELDCPLDMFKLAFKEFIYDEDSEKSICKDLNSTKIN